MLATELREPQGGHNDAHWPTQKDNRPLYQELRRVRADSADCAPSLQQFPSPQVNDSFAVSFVAASAAGDPRAQAREFASAKMAKPEVNRREFDAQAAALTTSNVVFAEKTRDKDLVARRAPDPDAPVAPHVIADAVAVVPLEESHGRAVAKGPSDAVAAGEETRLGADIAAAREARHVARSSQEPWAAMMSREVPWRSQS